MQYKTTMDPVQFVKRHGVVLEAGKGPRPSLAEAVAGGPIRGIWWGHRKRQAIFVATRQARDSDRVLVCHLVDGKITFVHRRLWPALIRLGDALDKKTLAAVREVHTATGAHKILSVPFPRWAPLAVRRAARKLSKEKALHQLGNWITPYLRKKSK